MKRAKTDRRSGGGEGWALVRECPGCGQAEDRCRCERRAAAPPSGSTPLVRLRLEKRRGKAVTVVDAEGLAPEEVRALGRELKVLCGSGGTVRGAAIEVQGDQREKVRDALQQRGLGVKG